MQYDSTQETQKHISQVQTCMAQIMSRLADRGTKHDLSKLEAPEKEAFDSLGPPEEMAKLTYGSEEYKAKLRSIKPAINHHYAANDHHPEHWSMFRCPLCKSLFHGEEAPEFKAVTPHYRFCPKCSPVGTLYEATLDPAPGIYGMSLLALLEMLADWKAAGMRHSNGSLKDSLEKNQERFKITPELQKILENTARELGWV